MFLTIYICTNTLFFILRIKEQETHLNFQEYDDDYDEKYHNHAYYQHSVTSAGRFLEERNANVTFTRIGV